MKKEAVSISCMRPALRCLLHISEEMHDTNEKLEHLLRNRPASWLYAAVRRNECMHTRCRVLKHTHTHTYPAKPQAFWPACRCHGGTSILWSGLLCGASLEYLLWNLINIAIHRALMTCYICSHRKAQRILQQCPLQLKFCHFPKIPQRLHRVLHGGHL